MLWIVLLLAITFAELMTALVDPLWGIWTHAAILVSVILLASFRHEHPQRKLFLTLALAPLIRVLSLSMPLAGFAQLNWYVITSIPLLAATFVIIRMLRYRRSDVGLTLGAVPLQLVIALSGVFFGLAEYYILRPQALVDSLSWQSVLLPALILLVATGFTEELVFRGAMQQSAVQVLGTRGIVYVAAIFAVLHIGYLSVLDVAFVFAVALFFGWIVKRTGSLLGVTLSHGLTNVTLYLLIPFLL